MELFRFAAHDSYSPSQPSNSCYLRAYDVAALACKGASAATNFPASDYSAIINDYARLSRDDLVAKLRRESRSAATVKAHGVR